MGDEIEWLLKEGSELLLEYVGISHYKNRPTHYMCMQTLYYSSCTCTQKTESSANFSLKRTVLIPIPRIVV